MKDKRFSIQQASVNIEYPLYYLDDIERTSSDVARLEMIGSLYGTSDDEYQRSLAKVLRDVLEQMKEWQEIITEAIGDEQAQA